MKLAVVGGTGPTGLEVIKQALERGHELTAVVRNPTNLAHIKHKNLTVENADVFNSCSLMPYFKGQDAVVSCLGWTAGLWYPWRRSSFYLDTMKAITAAMKEAGVSRIVCMTSWCTTYNPGQPFLAEWIIKPLFLGRHFDSMVDMEKYLFRTNDVNFTIVKPNQLIYGKDNAQPIQAVEGEFVPYPFWEAFYSNVYTTPRAKVARFMLDCLETNKWGKQAIAIK